MQYLGSFVIGLIGVNALIFAALYSRKSRPELAERYAAWVLREELAQAEKRTLPSPPATEATDELAPPQRLLFEP